MDILLPVESILHLRVDELEIREVGGRHGKWEKLEFKFEILGIDFLGDGSPPKLFEDVVGSPILGSVPFRLTDRVENKLRLWTEVILGIELGASFEVDTDTLLDRECRGVTSQYRVIDPATNTPVVGHYIDSLIRPFRRRDAADS